jgi:hypothetical protein
MHRTAHGMGGNKSKKGVGQKGQKISCQDHAVGGV